MTHKRFLEIGSPLITIAVILRRVQQITILNPQDLHAEALPIGTFARIHSIGKDGRYTVWLLDESNMKSVMVQVPLDLMGIYFRQQHHRIFPHFAD